MTPRPKKQPSPGRSSWSGALPVWFEPTLAPWATLPLPSGQKAAIKRAWWWKLTNGPTRLAVTSPSETCVFGPIRLRDSFACRPAWACSVNTQWSTIASVSIRLPHSPSEPVRHAPER